jgi:hypothetical protein
VRKTGDHRVKSTGERRTGERYTWITKDRKMMTIMTEGTKKNGNSYERQ